MALMPVSEALQRVLTNVTTLGTEYATLRAAAGRTLAEPLTASLTHPPFDASAMDGYAVRAADAANVPVTLRLVGEAAAGGVIGGYLNPGEAMRIFTGAPVPASADTVVIQENTRSDGTSVTILEPPKCGDNIRAQGQDFRRGDALLAPGRRLNARDILLAASAGHAKIPIVRKPVVAILATGDELVEPGTTPSGSQIVASNSYAIAALVEAAGGDAQLVGIARDTHGDLAAKLAAGAAADILITTGGASVGDHDLVRPALEAAGATLDFYKIAMRPGKPLFFGTRPRSNGATPQRILGLPGNPLSALVGARIILVPLIARLLGRWDAPQMSGAVLAAPIGPNGPRDHYMRATLDASVSPPRVTPLPSQDSALVSALAAANCLIVVPADTPAQAEGSRVTVMLLDF